ncbi:MAG: hypothetical protein HY554_15360, partial [Elusimicrobia bacterium]|nr:hypothetical protein [Elusimicrobiota bacterium]
MSARRGTRLLAALALAGPVLSFLAAGRAQAANNPDPRIVAPGTARSSSQRHLVANAWGYWAFFEGSSGNPAWSYSPTGDDGTWRSDPSGSPVSADIFDGTGFTGMNDRLTVWYVDQTSHVYVAVGDDTTAVGSRVVHLRKGQLRDNGTIDWLHEGQRSMMEDCADTAHKPYSEAAVGFALDREGYPWLILNGGNAGLTTANNKTAFLKGITPFAVGSSSWPAATTSFRINGQTCGGNPGSDGEGIPGALIAPHIGGAANKVWAIGYDGTNGAINRVYVEDNNASSNAEIPTNAPQSITPYAAGGLEYKSNISAVVDNSNNLHVAWINNAQDLLYARFVATAAADGVQGVHTFSAGTYEHVSIGLASGTADLGDRVFMTYINNLNELYVVSADTNVHVPGGWTSEYTNVDASAEYVSFAYSAKRPFPLPFMYHSGPNEYYDWV